MRKFLSLIDWRGTRSAYGRPQPACSGLQESCLAKRGQAALLVVFLVLPALAAAQATARPTVSVNARGSVQAAPDTAVVNLAITGQSARLTDAYSQAQHQAAQVRALLNGQGFQPAQAHWSGFQVMPNRDPKTQHIVGYTVRNDLELDLTTFTQIGPLLDTSTGRGLAALRSVSFELRHPEAAESSAIADGYRQAHEEAAAFAQAAGLQLEALQHANVNTFMPMPRPILRSSGRIAMAGPDAAPTAQFTPGLITVTASVSASYYLGHN
ncbi:MAG: SIMPL domain-containing protein [Terriglobales bacterium]